MPHGRFSGAVFNMWLHSSCCGDLATATAVACMSFAHPALGQPSDLLTTGPWSFLELPLQWFGLVSAKQHVWGGPCSSRFSAVVLCPVYSVCQKFGQFDSCEPTTCSVEQQPAYAAAMLKCYTPKVQTMQPQLQSQAWLGVPAWLVLLDWGKI